MRGREKGQAAVEFMVVAVVVFFFLLFFLSVSMGLITSSYMEYATFMAARTYKAGFASREAQQRYARIVFRSYTDKLPSIVREFNLNFVRLDPNDDQTEGVVSNYTLDLFYLPPLFVKQVFPSAITLQSEAYLGRDPGYFECLQFFTQFAERSGFGSISPKQLEDNGC